MPAEHTEHTQQYRKYAHISQHIAPLWRTVSGSGESVQSPVEWDSLLPAGISSESANQSVATRHKSKKPLVPLNPETQSSDSYNLEKLFIWTQLLGDERKYSPL